MNQANHKSIWRAPLVPSLTAGFLFALFLTFLPGYWSKNANADYLQFYEPVARNVMAGKGLVGVDGMPAVLYPPGYPLVLAGIFQAAQVLRCPESCLLRAFTLLAIVATTLLIYFIARPSFGNKTACTAALFWAAYPFQLWLAKQPNVESPFMVLLFLALLVLMHAVNLPRWSPWAALFLGALVGAASLLRPIAILLSGALLLGVWLYTPSWKRSARASFCLLVLLGNCFTVLPWEMWAHHRIGRWIPLSENGPASVLDGLTFAVEAKGSGRLLPVPSDVRELMLRIRDQSPRIRTTVDVGRLLAGELLVRPIPVMKLFGLKVARAWYATYAQWFEEWILLLQLPCLGLAVIGMVVSFRNGQRQRSLAGVILLVTLYFWAMSVVALSILRYMVPVMGLLMICAARGALQIVNWLQGRPWSKGSTAA
jgi:4-amino-4-deoxy-L-arabinose transferase-like glycosyltransferase